MLFDFLQNILAYPGLWITSVSMIVHGLRPLVSFTWTWNCDVFNHWTIFEDKFCPKNVPWLRSKFVYC